MDPFATYAEHTLGLFQSLETVCKTLGSNPQTKLPSQPPKSLQSKKKGP